LDALVWSRFLHIHIIYMHELSFWYRFEYMLLSIDAVEHCQDGKILGCMTALVSMRPATSRLELNSQTREMPPIIDFVITESMQGIQDRVIVYCWCTKRIISLQHRAHTFFRMNCLRISSCK
jgi:hypothetical protein